MNKVLQLLLVIIVLSSTTTYGQDILPPVLPWKGKSEKLIVNEKHPWVTPSELSDLTTSPNYDETMVWYRKLSDSSPYLSMVSIGESAQKRNIYMIIASKDKIFTPQAITDSEKPTLLAQAGIHSGEIDGKDAGMMLLRDIVHGKKVALLDKTNFLFIPILNVDGHERRSEYGRVNQRGPKKMGWRTNAKNLNLNRDYTKLETEGIQAVMRVINQYSPDLYMDIHVTDGADYQYDITYGDGGTTTKYYSPSIANWMDMYYKPQIDKALRDNNHVPGPLMFTVNGEDFSGGCVDMAFTPRFSHSYGDVRHLPAILVENHSLKPYKQRVLGTYVFLEQTLKTMGAHANELYNSIDKDQKQSKDSLALTFKFPEQQSDSINQKGIKYTRVKSSITGLEYVKWLGEPIDQKIWTKKENKIADVVKIPKAYWVPVEWFEVINKIKAHGILVEELQEAKKIEVDQYFIKDYKISKGQFEGRVRMDKVEVEGKKREINYLKGSVRVTTDQPLGNLLVLLMEPASPDGFFQWGFYHSILAKTEYIEKYAMEPLIAEMVEKNPELENRFKALKESDPEFAKSPRKIYRWFYEQTPYFDHEWKIIPIGREW